MNSELRKIMCAELRKEANSNFFMPDYYAGFLTEVADLLENGGFTMTDLAEACAEVGISDTDASELIIALWNREKE